MEISKFGPVSSAFEVFHWNVAPFAWFLKNGGEDVECDDSKVGDGTGNDDGGWVKMVWLYSFCTQSTGRFNRRCPTKWCSSCVTVDWLVLLLLLLFWWLLSVVTLLSTGTVNGNKVSSCGVQLHSISAWVDERGVDNANRWLTKWDRRCRRRGCWGSFLWTW